MESRATLYGSNIYQPELSADNWNGFILLMARTVEPKFWSAEFVYTLKQHLHHSRLNPITPPDISKFAHNI